MKRTLAQLFFPLLLASSLPAQTFTIDNGKYQIPNGSSAREYIKGTKFPDTIVGSFSNSYFTITANSTTTFESAAITGPGASDFSLYLVTDTVPAGNIASLSLTFNPSSAGTKNATVSLISDAPGIDGNFTFAISGTGVGALPGTAPDLDIFYPKPKVKIKPNKKTPGYTVQIKDGLYNIGTAPTGDSIVQYYFSDDAIISQDDILLGQNFVKAIPVAKPGKNGKPPKYKAAKLKLKATSPYSRDYLIKVSHQLDDSTVMESYYENNFAYFIWD